MTKEQLIAMGLTEEQATKVMASLDGSYIPKSRFDEVNERKNQLEKDVASRDKQIEDLKKVDAEGLKAEIEKLQGENKAAKEKFESDMKQLQINGAVERALTTAKAKNLVAVKALLADFITKAELDGENVKGLDDEVKKLVEGEDTKFLFDADTTQNKQTQFKGIKPGDKSDQTPDDNKPTSLADAVKIHFESQAQE